MYGSRNTYFHFMHVCVCVLWPLFNYFCPDIAIVVSKLLAQFCRCMPKLVTHDFVRQRPIHINVCTVLVCVWEKERERWWLKFIINDQIKKKNSLILSHKQYNKHFSLASIFGWLCTLYTIHTITISISLAHALDFHNPFDVIKYDVWVCVFVCIFCVSMKIFRKLNFVSVCDPMKFIVHWIIKRSNWHMIKFSNWQCVKRKRRMQYAFAQHRR